MIVDPVATLPIDNRVPYPIVHVEETEEPAVRCLGLSSILRDQGIEIEKVSIEMDALDH